jgi:7,8-dihydropterin-6-yl-methyl-4-(beta-D-ribofuranosyl)aminobenzene 5'-phosphate synthase
MTGKNILISNFALSLILLFSCCSCQRADIQQADNDLDKRAEQEQSISTIQSTTIPTDIVLPASPTPDQTQLSEENGSEDMIDIQIVFDNYTVRDDLTHDWGFAAYISYQDHNVLFDTGASGSILLNNMRAMGIQAESIQHIILSHEHDDHTGGLESILASSAKPNIYILPSFTSGFKERFQDQGIIIEVKPGQEIIDQIYTTGEIPGSIPEQALIINTTKGLVIITGCAHPGVENMVRAAKQNFEKEIYLVMGGFHLSRASENQVHRTIEDLQQLGVLKIAPCHCTGSSSINQFQDAFGDDFLKVGVGTEIQVPD